MASKVNTKFVIILAAGLLLVGGGVGGAFYMFKMRSGEHYVSLGDKAMAEGKFDVADKWYERAVGKEQFNVPWLTKWKAAREKIVPDTQNGYFAAYRMYHGILRNLAQAQKTNVAAHRDHLELIYQECAFGGNRAAWEYLASTVDESLAFFETDPENPSPPALRRYRGLALLQLWLGDSNTPKDRIELARQDLEVVLKADPKDGWVASALSVWHRRAADAARTRGDDAEGKSHDDLARKVFADYVAANPSDPMGLLGSLTTELYDIDRASDPLKSTGENTRRREEAVKAMVPRLVPLIDAAKATPNLSSQVVNQIVATVTRVDPENGRQLSLGYVNHLLNADPSNADLLLISAQLIGQADKPDLQEMIAAYQKLIDLKDKPVSLEGIRLMNVRNRARFAQASSALQAAAAADNEADRKKQMESARSYRNELARNIPENSPELMFIDAKSALLDGTPDIPKARSLLAQFLKSPGDVPEGVILEASLLMADVGMRSNPPEPGLARENLIRVLAARPASVEVRGMLAQVERALQNYEGAVAQLKAIIDLDPENAKAKEDLRTLLALTATTTDVKVDDPVVQALIDAERLANPTGGRIGDNQAAMDLLERALVTHNHDPRLVMAVATAKFRLGDREGAKAALEAGIARNPDAAKPGVDALKDFDRRLRAADSLEGAVAFVKEAQVSDIDRALILHATYLEFKKPDEAAAALNEAEKISPDHPRVIELRFQAALNATPPDIERANQLTERAIKLNLDQAEGDTYRARVQIAQKAMRDAAATLTRAVARGSAPAGVHRLLGLVQADLGRMQDAMTSFRRAIELVPNDLLTIKTYLSVLVKAGENAEALGVARKSQTIGRSDPEFLNLWLALESRAGRNDFARERREEIFKRNPKDTNNTAALAEICLEQKQWDRARQLIDQLRASNDELRLVVLDARWHADRGTIDPAKQVFREYLAKVADGPDKLQAYLAFGQFLMQRGFQREGLAAYRQAAQFQDPKTMAVDLLIGDILISNGMYVEAEAAYRKVLDAGVPDADLQIRKRLVEALNQQQKFAEAETVFTSMGAAADGDVEVLAQRASAARGLGNTARAKEYLDRAIAKFPDEPMPYLRRARLSMQEAGMMSDAMADLATAIRLRPSFWQALRTRAMMHLAEGKTDDGLRDLKEAVERNPNLDDLRIEYLDYLVRLGRESEAVDTADAALATRPNDTILMGKFASIFAQAGRWSRAARYYKQLWEQVRTETSALAYCNALLTSTPPGLAEAESVLAFPDLKAESSWRLMLVRAVLRKKQGKDQPAREDLVASFDLIGANGPSVLTWADDTRNLYPSAQDRLALLNTVRVPAQIEEWVAFAKARIALEDNKNIDDTLPTLRALRDKIVDNNLRGQVQFAIADALARQSKWRECIDEIRLGLQFRPTDPVLSNNAAAILSEYLSNPREALPFAERAVSTDPGNANYLDTLAAVLWQLGEKAQAMRKLGDSLRLARTEADKARAAMKLARWKHESGDPQGARSMIDLLREMTTDNPALKDSIKTEFEKLLTDLNAK